MTVMSNFVKAHNYTPAWRSKVDLVVLHSMESKERTGVARDVALWFADPLKAPKASAHYCIDDREVILCVQEHDIAWHAPGVNKVSIGIEHAGRADQLASMWDDVYSKSVLALSVQLCAEICQRWGIPAEFIDSQGLLAKKRGITTHAEVSRAFRKSTHWDPGPNFPIDLYVRSVEMLFTGGTRLEKLESAARATKSYLSGILANQNGLIVEGKLLEKINSALAAGGVK